MPYSSWSCGHDADATFAYAGDIHLGTHLATGKEVAIKLEPMEARHPQLEYEYKFYKTLAQGVGVP